MIFGSVSYDIDRCPSDVTHVPVYFIQVELQKFNSRPLVIDDSIRLTNASVNIIIFKNYF